MPSNGTSNQFVVRDIPASVYINGVDGVAGNAISVTNLAAANGVAQFTTEIWFRPVSPKAAMVLYDNSQAGVTDSFYLSVGPDGGLFSYQTIGGVVKNILNTDAKAKMNQWNLVNVTYNGSLITIFLNGTIAATLSATGTLGSNTGTFRIGAYYTGATSQTYLGYLHRPRVYTTSMTLQEHQDRYYSNKTSTALQAALIMDLDTTIGGTGTSLTDLSGAGNTGTMGASASWGSDSPFRGTIAARAPQTSLSFSAVAATNQVTFTHISAYTFSKVVTCSFWAKAYAVQSDAEIFGKNNAARYPFVFRYNNSNGRVQFGAYDGTFNPSSPTNNALLPKDGWVHFVGTRDGVRLKLYRNATLISDVADTTVATTDNTNNMTVGNRGGSTKWFDGAVSEVRVFNATLTQAQVSDLFLRGRNPVAPILSAPLSNGGGAVATDTSTNANNGTITGATWSSDAPFKQSPLARHYESSLVFNGTSSALVKTTPTGINTGTSSRSVSGWIYLTSNAIQTIAQFKVNGSNQSPAFVLGQISNTYYFAFDTINAGNNLTMTLAQFTANFPLYKWLHVAYVMTTTTISLYVNGFLVISSSWGTAINTSAYDNLFLGKTQDGANTNQYWFAGRMQDIRIHNAALTQTEIQAEYLDGKATTTLASRFIGQEGAGSTVSDSVGTNHLTNTNVTWISDTPMKKGRDRSGNLVKNGNFDYAPPFTAATTTSSRYIDGSSGGSATNDLFGWFLTIGSGFTGSAQFDTSVKRSGAASLKLVSTVGNGASTVGLAASQTAASGPTVAQQNQYLFRVSPNTDYVLTAYIKPDSIVSTDGNGARIRAVQYGGVSISNTGTSEGNNITGTSDWSVSTVRFTTGSSSRFIQVLPVIYGDTTGTAWFDDISLTPVFPEGQKPANGNLIKNYDFEVIPTFTAAQNTAGTWITGTAGGSSSNATYKWSIPSVAISASAFASFDTTVKHWGRASLKLEVTDATGTIVVATLLNAAIGGTTGSIPVLPNTTYSFSAWIKTLNVPTNAVYMDVREFNSLGSTITTTSSNKLSGTNDWTQVSGTFTTNSATKDVCVLFRDGTAGQANTVWIDDVYLGQ